MRFKVILKIATDFEEFLITEPDLSLFGLQLSYLMLIERSNDANLIAYVDVIVNQVEYQYEVRKG